MNINTVRVKVNSEAQMRIAWVKKILTGKKKDFTINMNAPQGCTGVFSYDGARNKRSIRIGCQRFGPKKAHRLLKLFP